MTVQLGDTRKSTAGASTIVKSGGEVIAPEDLLSVADPNATIAGQGWNLLCLDKMTRARDVSPSGAAGLVAGPGVETGFQVVDDPEGRLGRVFRFGVHVSETGYKTKHRCEISHAAAGGRGLPSRVDVWHGFSIKADNWVKSSDEQILAQWNSLVGGSQNPIMALTLAGDELSIRVRYNVRPGAPKESNGIATVWAKEGFDLNTWHDIVLRARISYLAADGPFMEVWIDGVLVGRYDGPFGYNAEGNSVAKFGYYRYVQPKRRGGDWPMNQPLRQLYYGKSLVVQDPRKVYSVQTIRAAIGRQ
jgi:hypothetical protein